MKTICLALACLAFLSPPAAHGAGLAYSDNFIVLAPDQPLADEVLAKAEDLRRQIALEWLGTELPAGKGRTGIGVIVREAEDSGLTWPIDTPQRKIHRIWLRTSRDGAVGGVLAHEVAHVVFATHLLDTLPTWANEGIASLYDDPERVAIRARALAGFARSGNWPRLARLLDAPRIATSDQETYAASVSLVEYLLTRSNKLTVVRFALEGRTHGWDAAARRYYGFRTVADLQAAWQAWAGRSANSSPGVATRTSTTTPPDRSRSAG